MAARVWRWILGLAVLLAAGLGSVIWRAFSLSPATALAVALGTLLALPAAAVAVSFVVAQSVADDVPSPRSPHHVVRALLCEIAEFARAVFAMSGLARAPAPMQRVPHPARPVLLLHGLLCNGRVWSALHMRLHTAGFGPIETLDVEPLLADIDLQAGRVAPRLLALQSTSNGAPVVIIAHSMGGLIARALLRDLGANVIRHIVTLASPHHGTVLTRRLRCPATRQIARASPWLRQLNAAQEGRFAVPLTSIYTLEDNLVVPASSARLAGAELHELRGVGHFGVLRSRRALDRIIATLSREYAT
jgi:pimeloyl-ACP methyl ester carboxylesterase